MMPEIPIMSLSTSNSGNNGLAIASTINIGTKIIFASFFLFKADLIVIASFFIIVFSHNAELRGQASCLLGPSACMPFARTA